jgi:hypothetical protein
LRHAPGDFDYQPFHKPDISQRDCNLLPDKGRGWRIGRDHLEHFARIRQHEIPVRLILLHRISAARRAAGARRGLNHTPRKIGGIEHKLRSHFFIPCSKLKINESENPKNKTIKNTMTQFTGFESNSVLTTRLISTSIVHRSFAVRANSAGDETN